MEGQTMQILDLPAGWSRQMERYREVFSTRQYAHFQRYVTGLILGREGRNIQDIAGLYRHGRDQSVMNHFLTEAPWERQALWRRNRVLVERFFQGLRPRRLFLSFDDTVAPKPYGRKMQGAGYHYSTTAKGPVWGHCFVAGLLSAGRQALAYDGALYRPRKGCPKRQFRSKVDIAEGLVRELNPAPGTKVTVLADAWYFNDRLVHAAQARGFDWIFGCKGNRRLYDEAQRRVKASALAKRLAPEAFRRLTLSGRQFVVASRLMTLKKIGKVQVVFYAEVRTPSGRIPRKRLRQVVTNRLDWAPRTVLQAYMERPKIENFFKDSKQHLGLGEYQLRHVEGIARHWALVCCAHNLLQFMNRRRRSPPSLAKTILRVEALVEDSSLRWAYQRGVQGLPWRSPLQNTG